MSLAGVTLALLVCFTFSVLFPHFHTGCPRGPSVKTYLHLYPHLKVRFWEPFLNRFPNPGVSWDPPRIPSHPREAGGSPQPPCWLRSSTRMISFRKALGAVSRMLCTVLRRVDQASSWKQRMTLAVGRLSSGCCCRHLQGCKPGSRGEERPQEVFNIFELAPRAPAGAAPTT